MAGHHKWSKSARRKDALTAKRSTLHGKLADGTARPRMAHDIPRVSPSDEPMQDRLRPRGENTLQHWGLFGFEQNRNRPVCISVVCAGNLDHVVHVQAQATGDSVAKAGLRADLSQLNCLLNNPVPSPDEDGRDPWRASVPCAPSE